MNEITMAVFTIIALCLIMYAASLFLITVDAPPVWVLPIVIITVVVIGWMYLGVMA